MPSVRLLAVLAVVLTASAAQAATCTPSIPADSLANVFFVGGATGVWEYVPPRTEPAATSGGEFFLSWTDTPEDGALYVRKQTTTTLGAAEAVTLSLGSQDAGVQCVTAAGRNQAATTGECDAPAAEFALSCLACPAAGTGDGTTGAPLARLCTLRSLSTAPGQCLTSVSSGSGRSTPRVETRQCKGPRAAGQLWDFRLA